MRLAKRVVRSAMLRLHPHAGCMLAPPIGWPPAWAGYRPKLRQRMRYFFAARRWLIESWLWKWCGLEAERIATLRLAVIGHLHHHGQAA